MKILVRDSDGLIEKWGFDEAPAVEGSAQYEIEDGKLRNIMIGHQGQALYYRDGEILRPEQIVIYDLEKKSRDRKNKSKEDFSQLSSLEEKVNFIARTLELSD